MGSSLWQLRWCGEILAHVWAFTLVYRLKRWSEDKSRLGRDKRRLGRPWWYEWKLVLHLGCQHLLLGPCHRWQWDAASSNSWATLGCNHERFGPCLYDMDRWRDRRHRCLDWQQGARYVGRNRYREYSHEECTLVTWATDWDPRLLPQSLGHYGAVARARKLLFFDLRSDAYCSATRAILKRA